MALNLTFLRAEAMKLSITVEIKVCKCLLNTVDKILNMTFWTGSYSHTLNVKVDLHIWMWSALDLLVSLEAYVKKKYQDNQI